MTSGRLLGGEGQAVLAEPPSCFQQRGTRPRVPIGVDDAATSGVLEALDVGGKQHDSTGDATNGIINLVVVARSRVSEFTFSQDGPS
jgi:hypothetical protein